MKYRPEVDGLRAVAVLPVMLFHAGIGVFAGGYLGVDIFFVISGYLISFILMEEIRTGTFTFREFYERRARRILPALFLMMAISAAVGWWVLMPSAYKAFFKSIVSVIFLFRIFTLITVTDISIHPQK